MSKILRGLNLRAWAAAAVLGMVCIGAGLVVSAWTPEVYTATAIATQSTADSSSGRVVIRINAYTTDAERQSLAAAFQKSPAADGLALLRTMSKGYINIEGQPGRKIEAAFEQQTRKGRRIILVAEHELSPLEKSRNVKAEDFPLAVLRIQFGFAGDVPTGEIFPATKLAVTPDGFLDVQTESSNKVVLVDIAEQ